MKKQHRPLIKGTNWALSGLLGLLGFTSAMTGCSKEEYGTPWASYTIKGKVTDEKGKGISGIQVEIIIDKGDDWQFADTLLTQPAGDFTWERESLSADKDFDIVATDVDGEKNGSFDPTSTVVSFERKDLKGGSGWYKGKGTKDISIAMEEKEE